MKQWIILGLAGLGAWGVLQWWTKQRSAPAMNNAATVRNGPVVNMAGGLGQYLVDPLTAGVPSFNDTKIGNRPDQVAASQHDNSMATVPGSNQYVPAFGPDTNTGGTSIW
jgi:hypothetical protein